MSNFSVRQKTMLVLAGFVFYAVQAIGAPALANPYLAKPGALPLKIRIGTCAVTGGFVHLYTALDHRLFDKYGIQAEHVVVRGGNVAMAALAADEISFLYCNADANIARIGAGADGKLVAAVLIGLPYVVLACKDIKKPADLKGKSIGVTRPGDFAYRLAKEFLKKFNLSDKEVTLATVGGTPTERYAALAQDVFQATLIQPPLDARGRKDGFNVIYRLKDLGFPFIYSSLFTNSRSLRERPEIVQKAVAGLAEAIYFVEKNPQLAMNSVGKTLRITDADTLRSAYDTYARDLINRRMLVPAKMVSDTLELAQQDGAIIRRKPNDIFDNSFVENLEKSGFLKELWGGALPEERKR
ncbi:MAG TPA: ABC transporter substrate-binding protein [Candidatus Binatia bacterium]|nr:ABC transporter substrate-binding protein [Candidatus Binatia bacterium]